MFVTDSKAVSLHLRDKIFPRNLHGDWRPDGQVPLVEIDHHDLSPGLERLLHQRDIAGLVLDVMPYVDKQEPIDRAGSKGLFGEARIVEMFSSLAS